MLNTLTTTSASFLLLASLDAARRHLVLEGRKILTRVLELAEQARGQINAIPGLWCPGKEAVQPADSIFDLDRSKLVISAGDDQQTIARLLAVLRGLSEEFWQGHKVKPARVAPMFPLNPHLVLTPRKAFYAVKKRLKLKEAIGEIASEWIMTYPPGIPLILPCRTYFWAFLPMGANAALTIYYQSLEFPRHAALLALSRIFLFIPLGLLIFPRFFGLSGVWLVLPFAEGLSLILGWYVAKLHF